MSKKLVIFISLLLILSGVAARFVCIYPFSLLDGDSGVVGLSAKHILEGREFPIYLPLAHYGGTLFSIVGALFFKIWGVSSFLLCLVGILFSLLWGFSSYLLARKTIGFPAAVFAFVLVVLPPAVPLFFSLCTAGIYAETFAAVPLLFWLFCFWLDAPGERSRITFWLGFCSGFGLWVTPWVFPVLLTFGIVLVRRRSQITRKERWLLGLAFILGYLPAIIYNFQHPGAQLFRFGGRLLDMDRSVFSSSNLIGIAASKLGHRVVTLPLCMAHIPMLMIASVGWLNVAAFCAGLGLLYRQMKRDDAQKIASSAGTILLYVFCFCLFYLLLTGNNAPRYVMPLLCLYPVVLAALFSFLYKKSRLICLAAFLVLILHNGFSLGDMLSHRKNPGYRSLASWLLSKGIYYGYSDFDTAYPVMFEAREKVMLSPTLFHPTFSDRWPQDTAKIRQEEGAVFVINTPLMPRAESFLDGRLKEMGVSFKKNVVGNFVVFGSFSRKVLPEELHFINESP